MEKEKKYAAARLLMKFNKFIYNIEKTALSLTMYFLVGVLFLNVIFRFVLFIPSAWADELSRYTFTWLVLLGSSVAMYNWEHIDINMIDSVVEKFTKENVQLYEKIMLVIKKLALVISITYLIWLVVVYGEYLVKIQTLGSMSMFLGCSLIVPMSAIYFCSMLMIFHGVCYLIIPEKVRLEEGGK